MGTGLVLPQTIATETCSVRAGPQVGVRRRSVVTRRGGRGKALLGAFSDDGGAGIHLQFPWPGCYCGQGYPRDERLVAL